MEEKAWRLALHEVRRCVSASAAVSQTGVVAPIMVRTYSSRCDLFRAMAHAPALRVSLRSSTGVVAQEQQAKGSVEEDQRYECLFNCSAVPSAEAMCLSLHSDNYNTSPPRPTSSCWVLKVRSACQPN